jgi:predicted O-methyltransferase YrrM
VNPSLERLLAELIEFGRSSDAARADRRERLRNLEPERAPACSGCLRTWVGARLVLERGTSNGYSTQRLADAVISISRTSRGSTRSRAAASPSAWARRAVG